MHVRFGSKADLCAATSHVRFTLNSGPQMLMSALPPKADIECVIADVCYGPIADMARLFDHLVGTIKQRLRHSKPECLGGLQVNHQFEFGGGLHRQVSGLLAFKDAINVTSSFAVWINRVWPITDQATVGAVRGGTDRLLAIDIGLRER